MSCGAGLLLDLLGRAVGDEHAVAHEQQPVAALGLVHHVAGDQDRRAVIGEPVEQLPQVLSQDRIETDRRLVEHEEVGPVQQRDREADPRPLAAAEPADHLVGLTAEVDGVDDSGDLVLAHTEDPGEEVQVLDDAEVVVDAGGLGDVADPVAQLPRPGGDAEDQDGARDPGLDADQDAHQRGLSAARRSEQAGDLAHRDREVETAQDLPTAALYDEVVYLHRVIHHTLNCASWAMLAQLPLSTNWRGTTSCTRVDLQLSTNWRTTTPSPRVDHRQPDPAVVDQLARNHQPHTQSTCSCRPIGAQPRAPKAYGSGPSRYR